MKASSISKVTLRQEKLKSDKLSLYLDFYPPIWNPNIKKMSRREFLGLYLIAEPQDKFEMDYNEAILIKARGIRAQREMAIINEEFGFIYKTKKHADFLAYFEDKAKSKYQKWEIAYKHFCEFTNGRCHVKDITIGLCNDFRSHILSLRVKKKKYAKIATNSAAGYWSTFRALLKMAYKEGLLNENINDHLESIDWEEPKINFLEIEEIRKLAATSCKVDVLKRASLFACLTGLRISDILQLKWDNIEVSPDGGHCMRICTQKTKTQATLPLSEEALSYCGELSRGLVFKRIEPCPHPRTLQELAESSWNHQENHLPRSAPHLCHTTDNQRHRHLHRLKDARPQKHRHNSNLRRCRKSKETLPTSITLK